MKEVILRTIWAKSNCHFSVGSVHRSRPQLAQRILARAALMCTSVPFYLHTHYTHPVWEGRVWIPLKNRYSMNRTRSCGLLACMALRRAADSVTANRGGCLVQDLTVKLSSVVFPERDSGRPWTTWRTGVCCCLYHHSLYHHMSAV